MSAPELLRRLDELVHEMKALGYAERDVRGTRLSVSEALTNSLQHGHAGDCSKKISLRYRVDRSQVVIEIEDQGSGFDQHKVRDPTDTADPCRRIGRGIYLMRAYMTSVRFNARGNRVRLCKRFSQAAVH
ncbi:MAG: ATP-binding protein [Pirellulales bacterium]